ncbi:unnamed protein product [Rotaria socialis]|uniref:Sulfhydryl oxidase n=1 Tax=Rotaria socialis TaxID=392032 RepID=A0A817TW78_9BILA|nr:unnamed protein product [Rotaria socialis]CAF3607621.1 unnamed protein product [Rotaria socialis]CAF4157615.1 unnamed protein product [Rotaria socialis]CAF4203981.1 unnamed protein product [Rotaria socialis]
MKSLFIIKYINLILFAIIANIPKTVTDASSSVNLVSLYNSNDKITVLTSENFSSAVNQSGTAWLIEFYASWCGHCQSYVNTYREIAIDTWTWKKIVRVGALNCYAGKNEAVCRQYGIRGYPTLRLIPPGTSSYNASKGIDIPAMNANAVENGLIKELEKMHKKYKSWPYFTPVNRITFEEIYSRIPPAVKVLLVIAEKRDDFTGRQVMLDFSQYREQIAICRTTTDGKLWHKFNISLTDVPALFVIFRNRTAQRINIERNNYSNIDTRNSFNNGIRSFIHRTHSIDDFDDHDLEEVILRKNALKNADKNQRVTHNKTITDDIGDNSTVHRKVNMVDLELALTYMFRTEVPQMKDIQGKAYDALVQWLSVLTKYFPGRAPVMAYFQQLLSSVNEKPHGFSGSLFRDMVDMKISNAYLPNDHVQYQHCAGSAPQYRGYPCALWLLFHTLTVSQYQAESQDINVTEVLLAIKNYIKFFFGCKQCSDNFMKETINITQLDSQNKHQAIIYLWKVHNSVNKRLQGQITEDPKHPKVQFPNRYLCTTCKSINNSQNNDDYDISKTIDFLLDYYSRKNIDISLISNKSRLLEELSTEEERLVSTAEYKDVKLQRVAYKNENLQHVEYRSEKLQHEEYKREKLQHTKHKEEKSQQVGSTNSLMIILQHSSLYVLLASIIIILVLFRRRFCKAKTKRYVI